MKHENKTENSSPRLAANAVRRAGGCPECNNIARHQDGCRYGVLETSYYAAKAYIEKSACDPDTTAGMWTAWQAYNLAAKRLHGGAERKDEPLT